MPRATRSIITCSAIALTPLSFSCGSEDKAKAPSMTSIDETKTLNSLSATDVQTLCGDFKDYIVRQSGQEFAQRFCLQSAVAAANMGTATDLSQACHDAYTSCISGVSGTSAGITFDALCPSSPGVTTCSLTVATFEQCLKEIIDAAVAAWNLKDNLCDEPGFCVGTACNSPLTLPSTCVLVRDTCTGMAPSVEYTTPT